MKKKPIENENAKRHAESMIAALRIQVADHPGGADLPLHRANLLFSLVGALADDMSIAQSALYLWHFGQIMHDKSQVALAADPALVEVAAREVRDAELSIIYGGNSWLERLQREHDELSVKLVNLQHFMQSDRFKELPEKTKEIMRVQHVHMGIYADCLEQRRWAEFVSDVPRETMAEDDGPHVPRETKSNSWPSADVPRETMSGVAGQNVPRETMGGVAGPDVPRETMSEAIARANADANVPRETMGA